MHRCIKRARQATSNRLHHISSVAAVARNCKSRRPKARDVEALQCIKALQCQNELVVVFEMIDELRQSEVQLHDPAAVPVSVRERLSAWQARAAQSSWNVFRMLIWSKASRRTSRHSAFPLRPRQGQSARRVIRQIELGRNENDVKLNAAIDT